MSDKDLELSNSKEKIEWLEEKLNKIQKECSENALAYKKEMEKFKLESQNTAAIINNNEAMKNCEKCKNEDEHSVNQLTNRICAKLIKINLQLNYWQQEAERWQTECDVLRAKPESNEQLTEYYEQKMRNLIEAKQIAQSETGSLLADNEAMKTRMERLIREKTALESILENSNEELHTTSDNYRIQLDAMTEHLAAQNEKITQQCDEIQVLRHRLLQKK